MNIGLTPRKSLKYRSLRNIEKFQWKLTLNLENMLSYQGIPLKNSLINRPLKSISTQDSGQFGQFYLNIYYDCPKDSIGISKADSDLKWEVIREEEETVDHFDENLKKILKLKANAVIFSDEGVMGSVKIGPKLVGGINLLKDTKALTGTKTLTDLKMSKTKSIGKTTSDIKGLVLSRIVSITLADGQRKFSKLPPSSFPISNMYMR